MKEILSKILDENVPEIAKQVELKLPKLKKIGNSSPKLPQLKLPKLQKVK